MKKYDKRKSIFDNAISQVEEVSKNQKKLSDLKEYEDLLDNTQNFDDLNLKTDDTFSEAEIQQDLDEDYLSKDSLEDLSEIVLSTKISFNKKNEPVLMDKVMQDSKEIEEFIAPKIKFQTNKDDIKRILEDKLLAKKNKIAQSTNLIIGEKIKLEIDETKEIYQKLDSNILVDSKVSLGVFEQVINALKDFLISEKNPTTFLLTNYSRKRMLKKYAAAKDKTYQKSLFMFFKLFLSQMNFLEGKIENFININSFLEMKISNVQEEMGHLLKSFLLKNKKNQEFLNETNQKLIRLRKKNKKKLQKMRKGKQRQIEKMKEFIKESKIKEEEKKQEQKPVDEKNIWDEFIDLF